MGSKTIGANSAHLIAQSNKADAPGSTTVASVPMCRTLGFNLSGSGSHDGEKSNVAVLNEFDFFTIDTDDLYETQNSIQI